ncbi:MAG: aminopeptidase [Clostridiales bacterium]|nr:aminopeptidase [Clostridiales bacterium]
MSYSIFLLGLMAVSTLTGLVTEAIKIQLDECGLTYKSNLLAGIVALVLSAAVTVGYSIMTDTVLTLHFAVIAVALMVLSWLCAMLGYDKVVQAISQIKSNVLSETD